MAVTLFELVGRLTIDGVAKVNEQLSAVEKGVLKTAEQFKSLGKGMSLYVTAPIMAAGAMMFKLGEQFDAVYDGIRAGTGATGQVLEGLTKDFKEVVKNVPVDFNKAGVVVTELNRRLGLTGKPLQELTGYMAEFSRVTNTDLVQNATALPKLFNNWGIATANQTKKMDFLLRATQQTGISTTTLIGELTSFGPIMRKVGFSFEETTALIAGMDKAGVDASVVMMGLKKAIVTMAKEGVEDPQQYLSDMIEKIKITKDETEATNISMELFGARGAAVMTSAIREGRFEYDKLLDSLTKGKDTVQAAAKDTFDWGEAWLLTKNKLKLAFEPVGNTLFKVMGDLLPRLDPVIKKIADLVQRFGDMSEAQQVSTLKMVAFTAGIGPAFIMLGQLLTTVMRLREGFVLLSATVKGTTLFGSVGTSLGGILSVGTAVIGVVNRLGNLTKAFAENRQAVVGWNDMLLETMNIVLLGIPEILDAMTLKLAGFGHEFKLGYGAMFEAIFGSTKATEEVVLSAEEQKQAYLDAMEGVNAYTTAQHEGREASIEEKIEMQDKENAINALAVQYPKLSRAELEVKYAADQAIGSLDDETEAYEDQTQAIDDLLASMYKLYNINQSVTEATWSYQDAEENLQKVLKDKKSTDRDIQEAMFGVQDARETLQRSIYDEITATDTSTERVGELKKMIVDLGIKSVEAGETSEESFWEMAAEFGLSVEDVKTAVDELNLKYDEIPIDINTKAKIDTYPAYLGYLDIMNMKQQLAQPVSISVSLNKSNDLQRFEQLGYIPKRYATGGISPGGLVHTEPYEVLLNEGQQKNLADLIFGVADKRVGVEGGDTKIVNNFNIGELVVREEADINRIAEGLLSMQRIKSKGQGLR